MCVVVASIVACTSISKITSGQTVEIINSPGTKPNPGWLDIVVGRARSRIRHYLKNLRLVNQSTERLLKKALASFNSSMEEVDELKKG